MVKRAAVLETAARFFDVREDLPGWKPFSGEEVEASGRLVDGYRPADDVGNQVVWTSVAGTGDEFELLISFVVDGKTSADFHKINPSQVYFNLF